MHTSHQHTTHHRHDEAVKAELRQARSELDWERAQRKQAQRELKEERDKVAELSHAMAENADSWAVCVRVPVICVGVCERERKYSVGNLKRSSSSRKLWLKMPAPGRCSVCVYLCVCVRGVCMCVCACV